MIESTRETVTVALNELVKLDLIKSARMSNHIDLVRTNELFGAIMTRLGERSGRFGEVWMDVQVGSYCCTYRRIAVVQPIVSSL
jgi:hypothetical protein